MKYRKVLFVLGAMALAAPLALAPAPALASIPIPICDVECDPPPPPPPPPPSPPSGGVVPTTCTPGYISNQNVNGFWQDTGVTSVNDVAAGPDGSLWYITGTPAISGTTVRYSGGTTRVINQGGKRIAIDAQGNPWIVDFNGNIWHLVNGVFQPLGSGQARDIAVAPDGTVWVIGTNSRNGSYQVWSWNGSWTGNPGSGEEIDVAANGDPVVNGVDGKVWIMNGGSDSGWSQVVETGNLPVFDMGLSRCSPTGQADVGGSAMWFVTVDINTRPDSGSLLFSLGGGEFGPYATTTSGFVVEKFLNGKFQVTAAHVAVDTQGLVWVVAEPGGCDCPGELLKRPLN